jgi:hypothetical protein
MTAFELAAIKILLKGELTGDSRALLVRKLSGESDKAVRMALGWSWRRLRAARDGYAGLMSSEAQNVSNGEIRVDVENEFLEGQSKKSTR